MERRLVELAQRGDQGAFSELAFAISPRLFTVAQRILRDYHRAEDATQQALVQIWRKLPKLSDPEKFEGWAYRILVNTCYAETRRGKRSPDGLHLLDTDAAAGDSQVSVADRDMLERASRVSRPSSGRSSSSSTTSTSVTPRSLRCSASRSGRSSRDRLPVGRRSAVRSRRMLDRVPAGGRHDRTRSTDERRRARRPPRGLDARGSGHRAGSDRRAGDARGRHHAQESGRFTAMWSWMAESPLAWAAVILVLAIGLGVVIGPRLVTDEPSPSPSPSGSPSAKPSPDGSTVHRWDTPVGTIEWNRTESERRISPRWST